MADRRGPSTLSSSVLGALFLVLAVAFGARAAAELLAPVVPSLLALAVLAIIFYLLFRRR